MNLYIQMITINYENLRKRKARFLLYKHYVPPGGNPCELNEEETEPPARSKVGRRAHSQA